MPLKEDLKFSCESKDGIYKRLKSICLLGEMDLKKKIKDDNTCGKFQLIFSSWNKPAVKPPPLSFPFKFIEFPKNEWACQDSVKTRRE